MYLEKCGKIDMKMAAETAESKNWFLIIRYENKYHEKL